MGNSIFVRTVYYDTSLEFYFNHKVKRFSSYEDAMDYLNKKYPVGENIYSADLFEEERWKEISSKYIEFIELNMY